MSIPLKNSGKAAIAPTNQTSLASFLGKSGKPAKQQSPTKPKTPVKAKPAQDDLIHKGLAQVVKLKEGTMQKTNFDQYTHDVEAVLINPNWNTTGKKSKAESGITIDEFA